LAEAVEAVIEVITQVFNYLIDAIKAIFGRLLRP
jgi:hypothetical protein